MGKKITTNIDMDGNEIERPSMHKLSSPPSNPVEGQFYYDTTSKTSYIWNGTGWVPMKGLGSEEYYGVCSTSEYTNIKTVSIPSVTELSVGLVVTIKFTKRNGVGSPKLKINDFTEKQMMLYGITAFGATDETNGWYAGSILTFVYDGSYFVISGKPNTNSTYSNPSFMNVYGKHLSSSTGTNISVVNRTGNNIDLKENGYLTVKFEIDVLSNAVMRVSNGGSHPIYHRGNPITTGVINAGDTALFIYKGLITDGNWELLAIDKGVMQGATDNSNGKQGYVPAPQAGDNEKFLKGDGTWCKVETNNSFFVIDSEITGTLTSDVYFVKSASRSQSLSKISIYKINNGTDELAQEYTFYNLQEGIRDTDSMRFPTNQSVQSIRLTLNWDVVPSDGTTVDFGHQFVINSKKLAPDYLYNRVRFLENIVGYNNNAGDTSQPNYEFDGNYLHFRVINFTNFTFDPTSSDVSWAPFALLHCGKSYILYGGSSSATITIFTENLSNKNFDAEFIIPNDTDNELSVSVVSDNPTSYIIKGVNNITIKPQSVVRVKVSGVSSYAYYGIPYYIYVTKY